MELIFKLERLWWFLTFFGTFACIHFYIKIPIRLTDEEKKKGFFKRNGAKEFLHALACGAIGILGEAMLIPIYYP